MIYSKPLLDRHRARAWSVFQFAVFLPPTETLNEWTEKYFRFSSEASGETGRYDPAHSPWQREIMECLSNPRYKRVVLMSAAQMGKTSLFLWLIGYHIHRDPCPILLVEPTLGMAQAVAKDRVEPMLRDVPVLRPLVRDYRGLQASRKARSSSRLHKSFPGGHLSLVGSNSVADLSGRPIRVFIFDEADRVRRGAGKAGQEGDALSQGEKRTTAFPYNKKIFILSSPGNKGSSRIEWEFQHGDQRHPYVPCPHCHHYQVLEFENFACDKLDNGFSILESAHFVCISCSQRIEQKHKYQLLRPKSFQWRAHRPESKVPSFWIWEAYSPFRTWPEIAGEHLAKLAGGEETYQTFVNLTLARTYEQKGDAPALEVMRELIEPYEEWTVPAGALFLTAGIDVQGDRIEASVWGWGRGQECWRIGHRVIYGSVQNATTWSQLDTLLDAQWLQPATGRKMRPYLSCIDSGYETQAVYAYCRGKENIRSTKGSSNLQDPPIMAPAWKDIDYEGTKIEGGVQNWMVGSGQVKIVLYSRMKLQPKDGEARGGEKFIHLPNGTTEIDLRQLSAEQLMKERNRNGYVVQKWVKRYDNEQLDCFGGAYEAGLMLGMEHFQWTEVAERFTLAGKERNLH